MPVLALAELWAEGDPFNYDFGGLGFCVEVSRLGLEVLQRVGVNAKPLPCELMIANLSGTQHIIRNVPVSQWPDDAWSLGVLARDNPLGSPWNAHLVIEWTGRSGVTGLLDLDLGRHSRPDYGICLRPTSYAWPDGNTESMWGMLGDDSFVRWTAARHLTNFKRVEAWRQRPDPALVSTIVAELKEGLAIAEVVSPHEDPKVGLKRIHYNLTECLSVNDSQDHPVVPVLVVGRADPTMLGGAKHLVAALGTVSSTLAV
jgi:hypothetical protein